MRQLTSGRAIGALFLSAFVLYGLGSVLTESDSAVATALGTALVVGNSAAVTWIGLLAWRVFAGDRVSDRVGARTYLLTRLAEATVLLVGLLPAIDADRAFWVAMLVLGVGSVPFCLALKRHRLVPRPLAVLGLCGYPVLALGAVVELSGSAVGYWFFIPGGLFELVLGVVLVSRGFRSARTPSAATSRPQESSEPSSSGQR